MQAHARDLGRNRRQLDAVIDLARRLRALRDVGPAMPAYVSDNVAPMRRVGRKRPMRAGMGFLLAAVLDEFGRILVALARRDAGIVRRLGRTIKLRPQLDDLRPQRGDLPRLTLDRLRLRQGDAHQSLPIERIKGRRTIHPNRESDDDSRVKSAKRHCRRGVSNYEGNGAATHWNRAKRDWKWRPLLARLRIAPGLDAGQAMPA